MRPNRIGVYLPLPEDGNTQFLKHYAFFRIPDTGQSPETQ
jgi:hypothetical protein